MRVLFFIISFFILSSGMAQDRLQDTTAILRQIDSLLSVSKGLMDRGEMDSVHVCLRTCARLATTGLPKDHLQLGNIKHRLGFLNHTAERYTDAKLYYLEALRIKRLRLPKNDPSIAVTLNGLGICYENEGNYAAAESSYLEAREIWGASLGKSHERYGWVQHNLGTLYEKTGRDDEALSCLTEALRIKETILDPDNPELGHTMVMLSSIYLRKGNYTAYEIHMIRAAEIWKKQKGINDLLYYYSRHNLANMHNTLGNYAVALTLAKEAYAGKELILGANDADVALTLITLANSYSGLGYQDSARTCLESAKTIYEQSGNPDQRDYAWVLNNLGKNALFQNDFKNACDYLSKSLAIKEKTIGTENLDYSTTAINYADALIGTRSLDSASLILTGQKAFYDYNKLQLHETYSFLLELQSNIDILQGRPVEALAKLSLINEINRELVAIVAEFASEQELLVYIKQAQMYLDKYLSLAFRMSTSTELATGDIYNQVIFYKGFVLDRYMEIRKQVSWDDESMQIYRALGLEKRKLADASMKLLAEQVDRKSISVEITRLENELSRRIPLNAQHTDWKNIRDALQPNEAAVEFIAYNKYDPYATDSMLYGALVITRDSEAPMIFALDGLDLFLAQAMNDSANDQEMIDQLYTLQTEGVHRLLWSPLEPFLKTSKRIYFSPAGLLHRVNLKVIESNKNKLLGEQYDLVQVVTTGQLGIRNPPSAVASTAAIFGAIEYNADSLAQPSAVKFDYEAADITLSPAALSLRGGSWNALSGSAYEVETISPILQRAGIHVTQWKGTQGSEENFKALSRSASRASSPHLIHISTHGYFYPESEAQPSDQGSAEGNLIKTAEHPLIRSGLILAGGNYFWQHGFRPAHAQEDGILTAYEISLMDLSDTELVVLSACETGLGDIQGNEGVFGLQRAFKLAGVQHLIMSLWKVPDAATAELMSLFYKNRMDEKKSLGDALLSAQMAMRDEGWSPYYWGGFILVE